MILVRNFGLSHFLLATIAMLPTSFSSPYFPHAKDLFEKHHVFSSEVLSDQKNSTRSLLRRSQMTGFSPQSHRLLPRELSTDEECQDSYDQLHQDNPELDAIFDDLMENEEPFEDATCSRKRIDWMVCSMDGNRLPETSEFVEKCDEVGGDVLWLNLFVKCTKNGQPPITAEVRMTNLADCFPDVQECQNLDLGEMEDEFKAVFLEELEQELKDEIPGETFRCTAEVKIREDSASTKTLPILLVVTSDVGWFWIT